MIHENIILKLPNDKELTFVFDEWDKRYVAHIWYDYDNDKINHKDYGVNAIANHVAKKFDDYALYFEDSMLTIYLYRW